MTLNVLYCCSDSYAPYMGVSMASLQENNRAAEEIVFYAVLDRVSEENIKRLQRQIQSYGKGRRLVLIDGKDKIARLEKMNLPTYRGSLSAYLRLFFTDYIEKDVKRLLYLDCDTLIKDDLGPLFNTPMGDSAVAVVLESLRNDSKPRGDALLNRSYFNAGVLLFDVDNWKSMGCAEQLFDMMQHTQTPPQAYDQNLLNALLCDKKTILHPRYNYQVTHAAYTEALYFKHFPTENYYSAKDLRKAREAPAILHAYRFLGQFPWHARSLHPYREQFWVYASKSEWSDLSPRPNHGLLFMIERLLWRTLPHSLFLTLFKRARQLSNATDR